jgi:hypothetical protein
MSEQNKSGLRSYYWSYFDLHATQRLTTFNFYIVMCTLIGGGYVAVLKEDSLLPLGVVLGLALILMSFVFWKLEIRNKQLIKNAEAALKKLDADIEPNEATSEPSVLRLFEYDEHFVGLKRKKKSFWFWRNHWSYSNCFNTVFALFGILGLLAAVYAVICIVR